MSRIITKYLALVLTYISATFCIADEGKLLGTAGLHQIEGSGGGGIVPWATIAGYESQEAYSFSAFNTNISLQDFRLQSTGIAMGFKDKCELSIARQKFDLKGAGAQIRQDIVGIKVKLYGDLIYSQYPQLSVGIQHKSLADEAIALAVGAADTSGTDLYFSATKAHLAAFNGKNIVWNLTGRFTKANQLGLLGFGSQSDDKHDFLIEASAGIFINKHWITGIEYRQKPSNLAFEEDDWFDLFTTYVPNKNFSITAAYADVGTIATSSKQSGIYLSFSGYF